jgi:hypothetical protein
MAKLHSFTANVSWEINEVVFEEECEVNIAINGRYYPATLEQPEEYPEIEILKITDPSGEDITDYVIDMNEVLELADENYINEFGRGEPDDKSDLWDDCGEY